MEQLESDVTLNPYRLKSWCNYISFLEASSPYNRFKIYERAVKFLPRSYKLWNIYLNEREKFLRGRPVDDKGFKILVDTYERALVHLHKMPKIWYNYCKLLSTLGKGTQTRHAFDRALQSLPVTQHQKIWDLYIIWTKDFGCDITTVAIFKRYLMFDPSQRESFVQYLEEIGLYQEAVKQLTLCVDDPHYISPLGSTNHQLWMKLCDLCATHVDSVSHEIHVEPIIKSGIMKFSDEVGRLWGRLADFYVQQGLFDKARDIYEEALSSVVTVKDFTIVFDKYVKVEEKILTLKLQELEEIESNNASTTTTTTTTSQQDKSNDKITKQSNKKKGKASSKDKDITQETTQQSISTSQLSEKDEKEKQQLQQEIDLRLARIEYMLTRRPLLLNSVVLRQNPHNVYEWLKRFKILRDYIEQYNIQSKENKSKKMNEIELKVINEQYNLYSTQLIQSYAEAIKTINPKLAVGKLSHVWLAFANYYEKISDYESATDVYSKAIEVNYKNVEELANIWCAWGEMEMRQEKYDSALQIMTRCISDPPKKYKKSSVSTTNTAESSTVSKSVITSEDHTAAQLDDRLPVQAYIYKHVKVWNLYLDLEEGVGTIDTCRAAYERAIDLKVVTPQMMLNYASYLEERHYYDDSFRVYEKAVTMFVFPPLRIIWLTYIDKFIQRYGNTKIERLRDMFENALSQVTPEYASEFYIKYAKTEEELGLIRQAIVIYERATRAVEEKDRYNMYRLYAKKMEEFYGITKSRSVYERAIQELNDDDSRKMCMEFAIVETKLGEIDRARAIYQYGSQFAHPSIEYLYWNTWKEFEENHGNEDTYRDMLRIKRSVEAAFSHVPLYLNDLKKRALDEGEGGGEGQGGGSGQGSGGDNQFISFQSEKKKANISH